MTPLKQPTDLIVELARGNQKLSEKLVSLWRAALKDSSPTLRFSALLISFIAFVMVVIISILILHVTYHLLARQEGSPPFHYYAGAIVLLAIILIPSCLYVVVRFGDKAAVKRLDEGFARIEALRSFAARN